MLCVLCRLNYPDPVLADPCATVAQVLAQEAARIPSEPDPAKQAHQQALADALIARDPALEVVPCDYAEIARFDGSSEQEARPRYRYLELNGPEDGPGIQITLDDGYYLGDSPLLARGGAGPAGLVDSVVLSPAA